MLHVHPDQLERAKFYRVDHQRQTLVAEEGAALAGTILREQWREADL